MTLWLAIDESTEPVRVDLPADLTGLRTGGARLLCSVDGRETTVEACLLEPGVLSLLLEGRQLRCLLDGDSVVIGERRVRFAEADPRAWKRGRAGAEGADGPRSVKAPMPGRVVRVAVALNDVVAQGDSLIVIEAMKMQNELRSPKAGRVARLSVTAGDTVHPGDLLAVID